MERFDNKITMTWRTGDENWPQVKREHQSLRRRRQNKRGERSVAARRDIGCNLREGGGGRCNRALVMGCGRQLPPLPSPSYLAPEKLGPAHEHKGRERNIVKATTYTGPVPQHAVVLRIGNRRRTRSRPSKAQSENSMDIEHPIQAHDSPRKPIGNARFFCCLLRNKTPRVLRPPIPQSSAMIKTETGAPPRNPSSAGHATLLPLSPWDARGIPV